MLLKSFLLLLQIYPSFIPNFVQIIPQKSELLISLETSLGTLIGFKKQILNRTINVFYGVPYAEPPIGKLRFKRTKLIEKFPQEPYRALDFKAHCGQKLAEKYHKNDTFSEDCLHMNLFVPNLDNLKVNGKCKKTHQVMVYIYGGTSSIYQMSPFLDKFNVSHLNYAGDYFAALHDTIVITFNYRQELFSILYVENVFSGNLGLHDQTLAIQWTKKYIKEFCGNENNLTLFGNSFGANSIALHLFSKYSKNLISNAIIQSYGSLFRINAPKTKNELMINSILAVNELKCLNLTSSKIRVGNLGEKLKEKYFARSRNGEYILKKEYFLIELNRNFNDFKSKMNFEDDYFNKDIVYLLKFLASYIIDLDCLQNLEMQQIIDVSSNHTNLRWSAFFANDFLDDENSHFEMENDLDFKQFNKLNLNPKVNLLIGGLMVEECGRDFINGFSTLKQKYNYSDQFNQPLIPKADAIELIKNSNILNSKNNEAIAVAMAVLYTDETKFKLSKGYFEAYYNNLLSDYEFKCASHFFSNFVSLLSNSVSSYLINYQFTKHFNQDWLRFDIDNAQWIGPTCHADVSSIHILINLIH